MTAKIAIHETAFVTSTFRSWNEDLSRDPYAKLWPGEKAQQYAKSYSQKVSIYEPIAHCLRNRYFYDTIDELSKSGKIDMVINFGCGFSMYPFLFDKKLEFVEIDLPEVILFKSEKVKKWQRQGKLPKKEIHFLSSDFNKSDLSDLAFRISSIKKSKSAFVLLEGVLFFLSKVDTNRLFELFDGLQQKGDYIGSVSFNKSIEKTEAFRRLTNFVKGNLQKNEQFDYQTVSDKFYEELNGYRLMDHQNTISLAAKYTPTKKFEINEVLKEQMYLLKKG